ncbi:MAG: heme lyase CcmF/NrfE family subunit [Chloroflexi bacterium]|nr:heme lyase CcmF/NrfE family subunit [Chloroflexota bacterium]
MVEVGYVALAVALVLSAYIALGSFVGATRRIPELTLSSRYALYTLPLVLLVASIALIYAFVTHDFSVRYVAEHSNLAMPTAYTWVAFYAGNAGSLLFLTIVFAILSTIAVYTMRRKLPHTAPYATGILGLVATFFMGIIVFMANPLSRMAVVPPDGQGINPLLVHFGMFIHPPVQMTGLISVAIPFSIAIGAMLARRGGRDEWVELGRIWSMISWLILTLGLMLGAWWAYTILGWGGYWAWDPVENSALMPWLAMSAFIHSVMVQRRRGMFRMWNMVIIILAFTLAQMGMFINRGGAVPSVHSFAQSTMGWLFLMFMGVTLVSSLAVFVWRMDSLRSREKLDSALSREGAFLLQNVLFLIVAFVTLWGSIFPVIFEASQGLTVDGVTVTVGKPYFDRINGPILLVIVLVMGIGPIMPWRRATMRNLLRAMRVPLLVGLITGVVMVAIGIREPVAAFAFAVYGIVAAGIFQEWIRGTMSRHRKGENYLVAFGRLLAANRPRYGGYIVHIGILMLAVGATASSFFGIQRDFVMSPGEQASLGGYTFQYLAMERTSFPDRDKDVARFLVASGDKPLGSMEPSRTFYHNFRIGATNAGIRSTPVEDFYIVPSEFNDDGRAVFRVYVTPLVWWMWFSGPVIFLGTLFALSPQRQPAPTTVRFPAGSRAAKA